MDPKLIQALLKVVEITLEEISKNEELQDKIIINAQNFSDWLQEKTGNINQHSIDDAIQISFNSSVKRDEETLCSILVIITALYATHDVNRGAITGGTLLKYLGKDVFPHIEEKELRFSKTIEPAILEHVTESIKSDFHNKIKSYDINKHASFEGISPEMTRTIVLDSSLKTLMKHSYKVFRFVKPFLKK